MLPEFLVNPDPSVYWSKNFVCLDFETTNLDKGSPLVEANQIVLTHWITSREGSLDYHTVRGNEYELGELVKDCEAADFIIAQNAKFELGWLRRAGLDISQVLVWDTMIADYVLGGNIKRPHNLDSIAARYGVGQKESYISRCIKGGVCPSELPIRDLASYCVQDVNLTHKIFLYQLEDIDKKGLLPSMFTRCLLTPVLVDIESKGVALDEQRVVDEYNKYLEEYRLARQELDEFTGGINPKSPKQVQEFVYDTLGFAEPKDARGNPIRTDSGGRKTDSTTLSNLKARNKRQREFVRLKKRESELGAILSKNLEFFYGVVKEYGGIFYGQFNQIITGTHRLSSSGKPIKFSFSKKAKGVQFQNLPRKLKRLFTTRNKGWYVGEIDGAQLEFRVAAYLGQDARAVNDIKEGVDVHSFTSSVLTSAGQPTSRQGAKAHTFKPLYGGQSGTDAEQEYYRAFREKYPGISGTQERWKREVVQTKQLVTETGLIFHWPDTKITNTGYITNSTAICNYPVQSFATADIIPIAIVYLWHRMRDNDMESFIVNTIHDSAITEVHPDERELFSEVSVRAFTMDVYEYLDRVYDIQFNVPLGAEVKLSPHWSDGEEIARGNGTEVKYSPESPYRFH